MCVLSIKVPIRKKSGNLFNDPRKSTSTKKASSMLPKNFSVFCFQFQITVFGSIKGFASFLLKVRELFGMYFDFRFLMLLLFPI